MVEPIIHCDQCGERLVDARLADEIYLLAEGAKKIESQRHQRMFEGVCPEHGHRFVAFPNEGHSTLLASKLRKIFSKAEQRKLREVLADDDRATFQSALNGQYAWDRDDIARWAGALAQL